jgi:hypothetical protein
VTSEHYQVTSEELQILPILLVQMRVSTPNIKNFSSLSVLTVPIGGC